MLNLVFGKQPPHCWPQVSLAFHSISLSSNQNVYFPLVNITFEEQLLSKKEPVILQRYPWYLVARNWNPSCYSCCPEGVYWTLFSGLLDQPLWACSGTTSADICEVWLWEENHSNAWILTGWKASTGKWISINLERDLYYLLVSKVVDEKSGVYQGLIPL